MTKEERKKHLYTIANYLIMEQMKGIKIDVEVSVAMSALLKDVEK